MSYEEILKLCSECEHLKSRRIVKQYCGKCGCLIKPKALMGAKGLARCPLGKWGDK